jgi:hypothetical protein
MKPEHYFGGTYWFLAAQVRHGVLARWTGDAISHALLGHASRVDPSSQLSQVDDSCDAVVAM